MTPSEIKKQPDGATIPIGIHGRTFTKLAAPSGCALLALQLEAEARGKALQLVYWYGRENEWEPVWGPFSSRHLSLSGVECVNVNGLNMPTSNVIGYLEL